MSTETTPAAGIRDAYESERWRQSALTQRWLILLGGTMYIVGALWVSFRVGTDAAFATISLGLLIATALVYGLTFLKERRVRLYFVPSLIGLVYASHIILGIAYAPPGGAMRAAFLLTLLGIALAILAPTLRGFAMAQAITAAVAAYGMLVF